MKKILLWLLVLTMCILMVTSFSLVGCKKEAAPAEEEAEEEAAEEVAEEAVEEVTSQKITVIMPRHEMDLIGIWEQQTREFEEETGIQVELIQTEWEKAADKIQVELAANGSNYDVIEFDNSWVAKFLEADWVIPLDDYMPAGMKEELLPGLVNTFTFDGKLYGITWNNDTRFFMYNGAMLEEAGIQEPPHTFAELVEQTETLKEKGIANYGWADFWPQSQALANSHAYFLYSFGGDFFDDEGNPIFNDDAGIEALQFMVDALNDKVVDPASLTYEQEDAANIFYKGDTPFFLQAWPGVYAFSNDEEQSNIVGQVKVAEGIPAKSEDLQATLNLPEAFAISKFSKPARAEFHALQCVGEWIGDDMVKYRYGDIFKRPWSIQDTISYCMDTKISAPYPKSWRKRIYSQTFSEDYKRHAGMQYYRIQYYERPYTHGNDNSPKICSQ